MQTAAQLALAICQQMDSTKLPPTGNYQEGAPGPFGAAGQITNAQLVPLWYPYAQWTNYLNIPAWDANSTPNNSYPNPHPFATAAEILGIAQLIASGQMTLDGIAAAIAADPYLTLNDHYDGTVDLQTDAVNAVVALGQFPTNDDPLGIFGVDWGTS